MQVILLDKVGNLGNLGDVVKVKDGYARNYLIPQRMARRATAAAIEEFEAKRAELEKAAAEKLANAQTQGEKLAGLTVQILQKSGVDGRLFGSVTNFDIAEALTALPVAVSAEPLEFFSIQYCCIFFIFSKKWPLHRSNSRRISLLSSVFPVTVSLYFALAVIT